MVFGLNLTCFRGAFLGFSLTACGNEKCGFDTLFTMFAAHSHVRKLMKNKKNVVKIGDALWDSPGHAFELHFGGFWGPFGEPWGVTLGKKGVQRGIQKMMQKTGLRGKLENPG